MSRFLSILCFWLICLTQNSFAYDYELGAACIFKDCASLLKEWIEYHRMVGVEHFWLYNNSSTDNYAEILKPYIKEGIIELFDWAPIKKLKLLS